MTMSDTPTGGSRPTETWVRCVDAEDTSPPLVVGEKYRVEMITAKGNFVISGFPYFARRFAPVDAPWTPPAPEMPTPGERWVVLYHNGGWTCHPDEETARGLAALGGGWVKPLVPDMTGAEWWSGPVGPDSQVQQQQQQQQEHIMELTLADLRELLAPTHTFEVAELSSISASSALNALVGRNVFIRTVTHHHTGRLVAVDSQFLTLDDAAWIADDGRFADALATGQVNEVEPFPGRCFVAVGALVDVCEWTHDLPRAQK